ncbi:S-adenosyl-L-methionine-dependent methyltransferase [Xylaria palmicola]|nr:S-adenosyl-L-methionine-dependent methyltransferase [Xylaria palmicola]
MDTQPTFLVPETFEIDAWITESPETPIKDVGGANLSGTGGNVFVELPFSTLTQPASHFEGFVPPAPEHSEEHAVAALLGLLETQSQDPGYVEFGLDHFSIYIDCSHYPDELRPLQHLISRDVKCMYFDGILRHKDTKFYLRRVPFNKLPIGNYGECNHVVGDQIWIRSKLNESLGRQVYYKLQSPAPEYRRFHVPFLWIVNLAKHVIDYCASREEKDHSVALRDFKSRFSIWMLSKHKPSPEFKTWYAANGDTDFRRALAANIDYIFEEAYGLEPETKRRHPVWKETKTLDYYRPNLGTLRAAPNCQKDSDVPKTIVTPYVHDLFSHMAFGNLLEPNAGSKSVETKKQKFIRATQSMFSQPRSFRSSKRTSIKSLEPGDVISTLPDDDATTDTKWKRNSSKHYEGVYHWFGLIQKVYTTPQDERSFDVLWLYQPIDTPCGMMKYPWENELFLSDNCTCHPNITKVNENEILSTHEVEWFGSPSTTAEFFVRQTYVASDRSWVSLRKEHLICGEGISHQYYVGDTVLVKTREMHLETFIIECFFEEGKTQYARLRRLWRRKDVDKAARLAPPNELVYSQQSVEIAVKRIDRRCLVRVFDVDENIPPPYNCNGTGDAFFITHREVEVEGVTEYLPLESTHLESPLVLLRQGFNPLYKIDKLRGLDLFCGGGNFGRGLEEGGAVEMKWANDIWDKAIHTYMANAEFRPGSCTPFLGSIDNLLAHALQGNQRMPAPGDVHFISAGSPCPGFSSLTMDKTTTGQRKNQSLVASFASFVELFRPLYGVLENVPQMVSSGSRDSCVFTQLVCALVGLGYQVRALLLDAWSFGSSQRRTRVFLTFTAPGLRAPKAPKASHSHPDSIALQRLGGMSCGRPIDSRERVPTPFKFVSIREAIGNLPNIQDGKGDYYVGYPDHRLTKGYTATIRKQLECIPTHPYGMNFSTSWWGVRVMTETERQLFPPDGKKKTSQLSNGWGRINPNGLIGTIPTKCLPTDALVGRVNHWEQNRPVTILEARRAQGFPDHEVLLGSRDDQYKIVGNSVSRHVALVLGLAIREAWLGTLWDADEQSPTSSDEISTDSSKSPLSGVFTPDSLGAGALTPDTRTSAEPLDNEVHRKRTLPIYVELSTKRRRYDLSPHDY